MESGSRRLGEGMDVGMLLLSTEVGLIHLGCFFQSPLFRSIVSVSLQTVSYRTVPTKLLDGALG